MTPPTLATARLVLRPQRLSDFDAFAAFLASARAEFMGGPHDRNVAWSWFCSDEAQWSLLGHGGLTVTLAATGAVLGQVSIIHPPRFPETEIGWVAYDGAEGHGYLTEAARALRDWAFGPGGMTTLVSYIRAANPRSVAVAGRLGARRDDAAPLPDGIAGAAVWRHRPEWAL
jgi:RimJ/RimL family protein N-acetyltransferase